MAWCAGDRVRAPRPNAPGRLRPATVLEVDDDGRTAFIVFQGDLDTVVRVDAMLLVKSAEYPSHAFFRKKSERAVLVGNDICIDLTNEVGVQHNFLGCDVEQDQMAVTDYEIGDIPPSPQLSQDSSVICLDDEDQSEHLDEINPIEAVNALAVAPGTNQSANASYASTLGNDRNGENMCIQDYSNNERDTGRSEERSTLSCDKCVHEPTQLASIQQSAGQCKVRAQFVPCAHRQRFKEANSSGSTPDIVHSHSQDERDRGESGVSVGFHEPKLPEPQRTAHYFPSRSGHVVPGDIPVLSASSSPHTKAGEVAFSGSGIQCWENKSIRPDNKVLVHRFSSSGITKSNKRSANGASSLTFADISIHDVPIPRKGQTMREVQTREFVGSHRSRFAVDDYLGCEHVYDGGNKRLKVTSKSNESDGRFGRRKILSPYISSKSIPGARDAVKSGSVHLGNFVEPSRKRKRRLRIGHGGTRYKNRVRSVEFQFESENKSAPSASHISPGDSMSSFEGEGSADKMEESENSRGRRNSRHGKTDRMRGSAGGFGDGPSQQSAEISLVDIFPESKFSSESVPSNACTSPSAGWSLRDYGGRQERIIAGHARARDKPAALGQRRGPETDSNHRRSQESMPPSSVARSRTGNTDDASSEVVEAYETMLSTLLNDTGRLDVHANRNTGDTRFGTKGVEAEICPKAQAPISQLLQKARRKSRAPTRITKMYWPFDCPSDVAGSARTPDEMFCLLRAAPEYIAASDDLPQQQMQFAVEANSRDVFRQFNCSCNLQVDVGGGTVQCAICMQWTHGLCCGLSKSDFMKLACKEGKSRTLFMCHTCDQEDALERRAYCDTSIRYIVGTRRKSLTEHEFYAAADMLVTSGRPRWEKKIRDERLTSHGGAHVSKDLTNRPRVLVTPEQVRKQEATVERLLEGESPLYIADPSSALDNLGVRIGILAPSAKDELGYIVSTSTSYEYAESSTASSASFHCKPCITVANNEIVTSNW